jgi:hypothetical protein
MNYRDDNDYTARDEQVSCADCGTDFSRADTDTGDRREHCDDCCDRRDRWARAYTVRMAKADVTPLAGYLLWLDYLHAAAQCGTGALTRAWRKSDQGHRDHLVLTAPAAWQELQAIAARRVA